jgi:hypothetical protein
MCLKTSESVMHFINNAADGPFAPPTSFGAEWQAGTLAPRMK